MSTTSMYESIAMSTYKSITGQWYMETKKLNRK